ncbi:MAG: cbb3-type cytochrome c oxidase subunit 3 [Saprospirales bacterium]|nr:MAG: cbb3-type cytochrome c oxidase subunit 3 [Saprospirales bacterium]
MKFINYLETITGISIFPFLSLMIFFLFFTGVLIFAFSMRKEAIEELKNIPLQNDREDGESKVI